MPRKETLKKKIDNFLFDHAKTRNVLEYTYAIFMLFLSAFIFAFGFRGFIAPGTIEGVDGTIVPLTLATGGISGVSQIFVKSCQLIFGELQIETRTLQSLFYFLLNIPIAFLAWKGIGKRFAIFSIINVAAVSLFINYLPDDFVHIFEDIIVKGDLFTRALFGGICTGLSAAIAFIVDGSAGGLDVISYYFATKKSTSVGKYFLLCNGLVIGIFTILNFIPDHAGGSVNSSAWTILLYTIVYLFVSSLVIDRLSIRNKKTQIQIISTREDLPKILIANFPHGCTVVDAKGAFSGENKKIMYMVVSSFEVKKAIAVIQQADPHAFVNIISISQVYGKFFIQPIK